MENSPIIRFREIIKLLIDAGVDINEKNNNGDNPNNLIKKFGMECFTLLE
jgi:ankyrin repeat protein